jgi:hypothetical protein
MLSGECSGPVRCSSGRQVQHNGLRIACRLIYTAFGSTAGGLLSLVNMVNCRY